MKIISHTLTIECENITCVWTGGGLVEVFEKGNDREYLRVIDMNTFNPSIESVFKAVSELKECDFEQPEPSDMVPNKCLNCGDNTKTDSADDVYCSTECYELSRDN